MENIMFDIESKHKERINEIKKLFHENFTDFDIGIATDYELGLMNQESSFCLNKYKGWPLYSINVVLGHTSYSPIDILFVIEDKSMCIDDKIFMDRKQKIRFCVRDEDTLNRAIKFIKGEVRVKG